MVQHYIHSSSYSGPPSPQPSYGTVIMSSGDDNRFKKHFLNKIILYCMFNITVVLQNNVFVILQ